MAQKQKAYTTAKKSTNHTYYEDKKYASRRKNNTYVYGNTAHELEPQRQIQEVPHKELSNQTRKNREKAKHMNLGYVLFLVAALCVSGWILIHFIQLQSQITAALEQIGSLESKVNHLKLSNDEELMRIERNIDLEEIKRIAIGELGMTYAKEGQIETYSNEGQDYMRQATEE